MTTPQHDITIFNFDAVEQVRLWQQRGPTEAVRTLISALRAALLLGETVHLDRNQLFDGVFFAAVNPDRLAWHLGLEPGAKLPLTIRLLGAPPAPGTGARGPWAPAHGDDSGWGVADDVVQAIDDNVFAVAGDPRRVSSMSQALAPISSEHGRGFALLNVHLQAAYQQSDSAFLPQHRWEQRAAETTTHLIHQGRTMWAEAMKLGRVGVVPWEPTAATTGPLRVAETLLEHLPEPPAQRSLAQCLLSVTRDSPEGKGTVRSLIVRWLNDEHVPELTPSTFTEGLGQHGLTREEVDTTALDMSLSWWVKCYYRAIAARHQLDLYQFYEPITDRVSDEAAVQQEITWGLRPPKVPRLKRFLTRVLGTSSLGERRAFEVGGNVLEQMGQFAPARFAQLRNYTLSHGSPPQNPREQRERLADLALAVEDSALQIGGRQRRIKNGLRTAGIFLVIGLCLGLFDSMVPEGNNSWSITLFITALVLTSLPLGELIALWRLSSFGTKSTIEVAPSESRI